MRAKSPDRGPCTLSKKMEWHWFFSPPLAPIFGMGGQKKRIFDEAKKVAKRFLGAMGNLLAEEGFRGQGMRNEKGRDTQGGVKKISKKTSEFIKKGSSEQCHSKNTPSPPICPLVCIGFYLVFWDQGSQEAREPKF